MCCLLSFFSFFFFFFLFFFFFQARGGHNEAARYLIEKGADVTAVDENGDTALTVAKSPSMVRLLKGECMEHILYTIITHSTCIYSTSNFTKNIHENSEVHDHMYIRELMYMYTYMCVHNKDIFEINCTCTCMSLIYV